MRFFNDSIHVLEGDGKYPYTLLRSVAFDHPKYGRIVIPKGYTTDFASIPTRVLKKMLEPMKRYPATTHDFGWPNLVVFYKITVGGIVPDTKMDDPIAYAALVHDWIYSIEMFPRSVCDAIFRDILREFKVESRNMMYWAVRLGGWTAWPHEIETKKYWQEQGRLATLKYQASTCSSETNEQS